ncbi:hypothetical protein FB567DRAFT_238482 [Paraphoma chrysanthemicola]|uniref:Zn(2)-C6 fungal-type domain-containing protein n=1 Tax=Paraphoma chrysanthemicola TaxID=798071 RepID=A0A8K0RES2_9PLEO|nr:hypothetical protein FB567DRAFT_238482 [Paraphoma chrysanthemicola]
MSNFPHGPMLTTDGQPSGPAETGKKKQQAQQPRQLLSCTKCRDRKVKCDRTKPCSACCARGQPKDCHFVAEGGDYAPIQQSYELRKLRQENMRLKERLRARQNSIEDEDSDPAASPDSQLGERPGSSQKRRTTKQRRFQGSEWQDSIYFGSPGLASVVKDFAAVNMGPFPASLSHLMPRGPDMYTPRNPLPHPFPTVFRATPEECIPQLLDCLPPMDELLESLGAFERRVNVCSFPHVPFEITRTEVERFLDDGRRNAQLCPDMLALLFAAIALGGQHAVWDRSGCQWAADAMTVEIGKGNVYIAAAMQALRLASFMHRPSLLGIQALIMIGPYLTNSGRFLEAWTLFGTTIRLAHSIGLHRHPKYLDPAPPTQRECFVRQTLWWWMLHMDEQYSMTLGRPLGISGIGDCPPPQELTTNPGMLRFGEFVNRFTVLARQILSSEKLSNAKIDDLTDLIRALLETMPETLQFDRSWLQKGHDLPDWPLGAMAAVYHCKAHTYLILLNRQRLDKNAAQTQAHNNLKNPAFGFRTVNKTTSSQPSPGSTITPTPRGRALVLASSEEVLDAFLFLYLKVPAALISWTMGQQAFNSCMIILLDAMELKKITFAVQKVEKAYAIFSALQNVHELANLAVERISWGLKELRNVSQTPAAPSRPSRTHSSDAMHGAWSETPSSLRAMYDDTVMNATGMLLLEDPGLQSFMPESFSPISWNLDTLEPTMPFQLKGDWSDLRSHTGQPDTSFMFDGMDDFRSVGTMQGLQRSTTLRSAPTRYATPTVDDRQPQSITIPASHSSFAMPTQSNVAPVPVAEGLQHFGRPPHLRPEQSDPDGNRQWSWQPTASSFTTAHLQRVGNSAHPYQASGTQMRHNSCPLLPKLTTAPPSSHSMQPFNTQSTQSETSTHRHPPQFDQAPFHSFSETTPESISSVSSPTIQSTWAAKSTARPVSVQMADSALDLSCVDPFGQNILETSHVDAHEQCHSALSHSMHYSQTMPLTMALGAENMSLDEWKRWIGSSGAG